MEAVTGTRELFAKGRPDFGALPGLSRRHPTPSPPAHARSRPSAPAPVSRGAASDPACGLCSWPTERSTGPLGEGPELAKAIAVPTDQRDRKLSTLNEKCIPADTEGRSQPSPQQGAETVSGPSQDRLKTVSGPANDRPNTLRRPPRSDLQPFPQQPTAGTLTPRPKLAAVKIRNATPIHLPPRRPVTDDR